MFEKGKLYRIKPVVDGTGLPKSSIYRAMSEGKFPKPVKVSSRAVAWKGESLITWHENLQEA